MAPANAAGEVRPEFARGVLLRYRSVVLCPRCDRGKPELALGSALGRRLRFAADDSSRILLDMVQATGSRAPDRTDGSRASHASPGGLFAASMVAVAVSGPPLT